MSKWTSLEKPITAADAEAEDSADQLFGTSYDLSQRQLNARGQHETTIDKVSYRP